MANRTNLANGIVATAPSPATTGTSLVLQSGYGSAMPPTPFYLTLTPPNQLSTIGNSEIVYVTARSGDTLTIQRAKRGTSAKSIEAGWIAANGVYAEDVATGSVYLSVARTDGASLSAGAFSTLVHNVVSSNIGGGTFNTSTGIYTIPVSGTYLCTGMLRIPDNSAAQSIGQGIDILNADTPTFLWSNMGGEQRSGRMITKIAHFNAGDQVRHYYYASSAVGTSPTGVSFSLALLSQD